MGGRLLAHLAGMCVSKPAAALLGLLLAATAASAAPGVTSRATSTSSSLPRSSAEGRVAYLAYQQALQRRLAQPEPAVAPAPADPAAATGCLLGLPGSESLAASQCLRCHDGSGARAHLQTTHPVDLDYASAWARDPGSLRAEAEVIRRGGFLPEGKLRCTTCHDARSPWAAHLNLPPGAEPAPAVDPHDASTFAPGRPPTARLPLAQGAKVTPKPLCLLCHAFD